MSALIGTDLDNNENEMGKTEVVNVEKDESSVLEKPKVDNFEKYQAYVPSKK